MTEKYTDEERRQRGDLEPDDDRAIAPADDTGRDEQGGETVGAQPGERQVIAGATPTGIPVGNDPTQPGGGHGEGP